MGGSKDTHTTDTGIICTLYKICRYIIYYTFDNIVFSYRIVINSVELK